MRINNKHEDRVDVLGPLLDQYMRIFKEAVYTKQENISNEISSKLFSILHKVLFGRDDLLVNQLIDTKERYGAIYYQFCEVAIKNKDPSRFFLISHLTDMLQLDGYDPKIDKKYLNEFILTHIFRINQLILDHDDFELFEREVDGFCLKLRFFSGSPVKLQETIRNDLYLDNAIPHQLYSDKDFINEVDNKRNYLKYLIKHKQSRKFDISNEFTNKLNEFKDFVTEGINPKNPKEFEIEVLDRTVSDSIAKVKFVIDGGKSETGIYEEGIKDNLYKLYKNSLIYKTFFVVGGYILFDGSKGKIKNPEKYINELWTHTKRKDSDACWANQPPVTFDTFWLTNLLLSGGNENPFWSHDYRFGSFHGTTGYIYKYYLLCVTKEGGGLGLPSSDQLDKSKKDEMFYELDWWYQFSNNFNSIAEKLLEYCDNLIGESEKSDRWNVLFANAKDKLGDTKKWIEKMKGECERVTQDIEKLLPLDPKKIEECRKTIMGQYSAESKIEELTKVIEFSEERDKKLEFRQIAIRPLIPKDCFIKPSFVSCDMLWSGFGRDIASGELKYLLGEVLENKEVRRYKIRDIDVEKIYDSIVTAIDDLKEHGFSQLIALIPWGTYTEIMKSDHMQTSKWFQKISRSGETSLKIDEETVLKLFVLARATALDDVIILDKNAGIWIFKPDETTGERLQIEIKEYREDETKVDVLIKTVVNFRITAPEGIRILKLKSKSDENKKNEN